MLTSKSNASTGVLTRKTNASTWVLTHKSNASTGLLTRKSYASTWVLTRKRNASTGLLTHKNFFMRQHPKNPISIILPFSDLSDCKTVAMQCEVWRASKLVTL